MLKTGDPAPVRQMASLEVALPILEAAHEGLDDLLKEKHGELPEDALKPLERALQGIREATGTLLLESRRRTAGSAGAR
jgi:hypothetical protein